MVRADGWQVWSRRAKFEFGQRVTHRRTAAEKLRNFERKSGVALDAASKRLAREYAGDVLGSPRYAPWLYVYTKVRGAFVEGWIPIDFFDHVVIRAVNGPLRSVSNPKTFLRAVIDHPSIPDVGYIIDGHAYDLSFEPLEPRRVRTLLADQEEVVVKDDGGFEGRNIDILPTHNLEIERLLREHPNAVLQRRIRDHPTLRIHPDANGCRLRVTTCWVPERGPEARGAFLTIPNPGRAYSQVGHTTPMGVEIASGLMSRRYGVLSPTTPTREEEMEKRIRGTPVPGFARALALVGELHKSIPHLGVIGWDVMIDEAEVPWIIEWNTGMPGIAVTEATTGPGFLGLGWHELRWSPDLDG
jgi:hypothetical protein